MKEGEILEIEIEDMSEEGQGIGRSQGMVFFVSGGVLGDFAKIIVTKVKKKYAFAKVVELIKPSEFRVDGLCSVSGECGGCSLQGLSYEGQLKLKEKQVRDKLIRLGKLENPKVNPILGMEEPFAYRNKVQLQLGLSLGQLKVGFFKRGSSFVIDSNQCFVTLPPVRAVAEVMKIFARDYLKGKPEPLVYDMKSGKGLLRNVVVKVAEGTGEVMVVVVINGNELPKASELVELLDEAVTGLPMRVSEGKGHNSENELNSENVYSLESVVVNINKKQTSEIFGDKSFAIGGKSNISDLAMGLKFEISPRAFCQVNSRQTEVLYSKVLEYADLKGGETVFDLYCGVGTIGLLCAKEMNEIAARNGTSLENSGKVIGIESIKSAVLDANRNAVINGIVNALFFMGQAEDEIQRIIDGYTDKDGFSVKGEKPDLVILDPPRAGCDLRLIEAVAEVGPKKIVYVSCDPGTLARDIRHFTELGYEFVEATPVDMFPWTGHVESIILMTRSGSGEKK